MPELAGVLKQNLVIPRGGRWLAHAWVLLGDDGDPIRSEAVAGALTVVSKVRAHRAADEVLFTFTTAVVMLTLAQYGAEPVAAAQLAAIDYTVTSGWDWDTGVWDMLVDWEPKVAGAVSAPLLVSR